MLGLFCEKNMAIQTANLGASPSGVGGDTFRTAATKFNENFTNNEHAASRLVGTQSGNVMEVGAFGIGGVRDLRSENLDNKKFGQGLQTGLISWNQLPLIYPFGTLLHISSWNDDTANGCVPTQIVFSNQNAMFRYFNSVWSPLIRFLTSSNTTTDSNGFIKAASPVVQLFADRIELNSEAKQQEVLFSKVAVGDYLIQGSTGLAQQGWYVETPKDANGNALVAVVYEQLENQDISVKTYKKKFDIETASIVADLEQAIDIPAGRWIDIRLQELPEPEFVPPVSNTPPSFQPTGISQAVSEMMNGTEQ